MTLNVNTDTEAQLLALAQANGVSVEDFLKNVVEEKSRAKLRRFSADEWTAQFEEWADSFPAVAPISDEALSRESLYPDRW